MQLWIWHWHVARIISSQKIYGLYGLKHHIVEMRGGVTDSGQTTISEDRATQPMEAGGWVSQFEELSESDRCYRQLQKSFESCHAFVHFLAFWPWIHKLPKFPLNDTFCWNMFCCVGFGWETNKSEIPGVVSWPVVENTHRPHRHRRKNTEEDF